ncbi:MAG: hypothetical protein EAZ89_10130 [Bacteroidetes bacterium]|nr:MAG: hypothetical protein EAZ89_10130 [Bacteroidota bacterium]
MSNPGRFFLAFLLLLSGVCSLNAQSSTSPWGVGLGANMLVYKAHPGKLSVVSPYRPGVSLMLGHRLGAARSAFDFRTQLSLSHNVAFPNWESPGGSSSYMVDMSYQIVFRVGDVFFNENFFVKPYLFSGAGGSFVPGHPDAYVPLGGGLRFRINNRMGIQVETVRKLSMNQDYQHLAHAIAFVYNIGGDNKSQALPEDASEEDALVLLPNDRDGDLIVDADDRCPDEPGLVTFMGCPQGPEQSPEKTPEQKTEPEPTPEETDAEDTVPADIVADTETETEAVLIEDTPSVDVIPAAEENTQSETAEEPQPPTPLITDIAAEPEPEPELVPTPVVPPTAKPAEAPPVVVIQDQATEEAEPAKENALPCVGTAPTVALSPVYFDYGDAELSEEAKAQLTQIAALMKDCGQVRLVLEGHTDDLGSENENLVLSIRRAFNVKYYLVYQHNVSQSRITSRGMGEKSAQNSNPAAKDRAQNRRVDFQLAF